MKVCKNCTTINNADAIVCKKCAMKGMMVEVNENAKQATAIKQIYHACGNCGTNDSGQGSKCSKCNFPKPTTLIVDTDNHNKSKIS